MEREIPEFVFNLRGYLELSNCEGRPVSKLVPLEPFLVGLLPEAAELEDVWSGECFQVAAGALNLGVMAPTTPAYPGSWAGQPQAQVQRWRGG